MINSEDTMPILNSEHTDYDYVEHNAYSDYIVFQFPQCKQCFCIMYNECSIFYYAEHYLHH